MFQIVNIVLVSAVSIAILRGMKLYKSWWWICIVPILCAIAYGPLSAENPGDMAELAVIIIPPALLAPIFAYLFFRRLIKY